MDKEEWDVVRVGASEGSGQAGVQGAWAKWVIDVSLPILFNVGGN